MVGHYKLSCHLKCWSMREFSFAWCLQESILWESFQKASNLDMDKTRILSILLLSCFLFLFLSPGILFSLLFFVILFFMDFYCIHILISSLFKLFFFSKGFGVEMMGTVEQHPASLTQEKATITNTVLLCLSNIVSNFFKHKWTVPEIINLMKIMFTFGYCRKRV